MVGHYIFPLPSDEELQVFEKKINYSFANDALLREALQVSSGFNGDGNKKLALIGDTILDLVIVTLGCDKNKTRGEISITIQQRASNAYLADQGFIHGIDKFIVKNPCQCKIMPNVMATTMEAIIGAVYLDCNQQIQPCIDVMTALGLSWPQ
ncbi:hypothetical protein N7516_002100 [Penicillium verrucosum]|uniref:uncharacterized protein n=1 Tax=Penicillium verrucosum TaxID=60171 RepID=UPI0025458527|nr:uncharacterized protein N7516_002100 [Penicillium verrucosum]KAJ5941932.1 hypothetical protein N7516_002100 [Penicillium verrucosum]